MKSKLIKIVIIICLLFSVNIIYSEIIHISNKSGSTVSAIYLSLSGQTNWTDNLMYKAEFANGESIDIDQKIDKLNCSYDLRFVTSGGKEYLMEKMDLCMLKNIELVIKKPY